LMLENIKRINYPKFTAYMLNTSHSAITCVLDNVVILKTPTVPNSDQTGLFTTLRTACPHDVVVHMEQGCYYPCNSVALRAIVLITGNEYGVSTVGCVQVGALPPVLDSMSEVMVAQCSLGYVGQSPGPMKSTTTINDTRAIVYNL
jgi:hypothetical protein